MCDHILGRGFKLNDEEGSAYLHIYIRESTNADFALDDWTVAYQFCPCCGERNKLVLTEGTELLTSENS